MFISQHLVGWDMMGCDGIFILYYIIVFKNNTSGVCPVSLPLHFTIVYFPATIVTPRQSNMASWEIPSEHGGLVKWVLHL